MVLRKKHYLIGILGALLLVSGVGCRPDKNLSLEKKASPETFTHVGETITYTYIVKNLGGSDIKKISITDDLAEVSCPEYNINEYNYYYYGEPCTGTYQITEADMESGFVTNKATVRGYQHSECGDFGARWVSTTDELTITKRDFPALQLTKTGTPNWFTHRSQKIKYSYIVENSGNVTLAGPVTVTDDLVSVRCPAGDLDPGESIECTSSYQTTAEDVLAEEVTNTATASMDGIESNTKTFIVYLEALPELTLSKSADRNIFTYKGQLITYTFKLTNIGNVTIHPPFEPDDPGLEAWECPNEPLLPGEWFNCTGEYYVGEDDIGATLENCATVMGIYRDSPVRSNEACTHVLYVPPEEPEETACDINPNSQKCFCEQNPKDKDCP